MKRREGKVLGEDLAKRIAQVTACLRRVQELAPSVPKEAKANLESRLRKLLEGGGRRSAAAGARSRRCSRTAATSPKNASGWTAICGSSTTR
jgi:hypothetical protein